MLFLDKAKLRATARKIVRPREQLGRAGTAQLQGRELDKPTAQEKGEFIPRYSLVSLPQLKP